MARITSRFQVEIGDAIKVLTAINESIARHQTAIAKVSAQEDMNALEELGSASFNLGKAIDHLKAALE